MNCSHIITAIFLLAFLVLFGTLLRTSMELVNSGQMEKYMGRFDREPCDRRHTVSKEYHTYSIDDIVTIFVATKYKGESVNSNTYLGRGCAHKMTRCEITDSSHMADIADAVVFTSDINSETLVKLSRLHLPRNIPKIWFSLDAPSNQMFLIPNMTFDLTVSYRSDSDIHFPFGIIKNLTSFENGRNYHSKRHGLDKLKEKCYPRQKYDEHHWEHLQTLLRMMFIEGREEKWQKPKNCSSSEQLQEIKYRLIETGIKPDVIGPCGDKFYNCIDKPHLEERLNCIDEWIMSIILESLSNKTLTAAFLSPNNCTTESQSMELVKKINATGFKVDILGHCDNKPYNCSNGTYAENSNCMKEMMKPYKFFFAFEDEICSDFVTENFYSSLHKWNTVPIVFKRDIYENLNISSNLFIAMDDFNSTAEFVTHINNVNNNQTAYEELHRWRPYYRVGLLNNEFTGFCQLCDELFQKKRKKKSSKKIVKHKKYNNINIQDWYLNEQCESNFTMGYL